MEQETWKPIPGCEGYEVSDLGRVRNFWVYSAGKISIGSEGLILGLWRSASGYPMVYLRSGHKRKGKCRFVHSLVLEAFVGPCPPGMQACHYDGTRTNNRLDNLRWDTPKANAADKRRHGTCLLGERSNGSVLKESEVRLVFDLDAQGVRVEQIAGRLSVNRATIYHILAGDIWGHLGLKRAAYDPVARLARGTACPHARLTESDIPIIRELLRKGFSSRELGKRFGVNKAQILRIKHGKTWRHVPETPTPTP